ncbi:MAG: tRNA (N6-isopentenyl adenosine(37)-C2)-methylthiotransferase MiaB, partial [Candidatus Adiutrix sp.]|nr:tRNA (N6-isopentenyl adenosine(37)-C2)-methylthiotransferase MiaB [Candidatus Adiutrix sp.]
MTGAEARRAFIVTFGCQMNDYDSGRLSDLLAARGWRPAASKEEADFIFFNTCSIREKAARRVLNHLEEVRTLKKRKPGLVIAVGGCVAEQEGRRLLDRAPWLDLVAGPQHVPRLPDILEDLAAGRPCRRVLTGPGDKPAWSRANLDEAAEAGANIAREPRLTAGVTIMQGCDNYCAYCVVPYLRGPELSRPAGEILEEITGLLECGARDITLLGQNVNAYGRSRPGPPAFPELLKAAAAAGPQRLRFVTSHPRDFSPELIELFATLPALGDSLHLPVQSGSDAVLAAMRRGYSRADYLALVETLRRARPDLALTTDVIVGFPGETEGDFEATLSLVEAVGFDAMFSFKYSDRPGTLSAGFENKVPEADKAGRLTRLQARQKAISLAKNEAHIGRVLEVLVERPSGRRPGQLTGRARNFKLVHFDGPPALLGRIVPVLITSAGPAGLQGRGPAEQDPPK